jgi:hypothetical protein
MQVIAHLLVVRELTRVRWLALSGSWLVSPFGASWLPALAGRDVRFYSIVLSSVSVHRAPFVVFVFR